MILGELGDLEGQASIASLDTWRLAQELKRRASDARGLLGRHVPQEWRMSRALLEGRRVRGAVTVCHGLHSAWRAGFRGDWAGWFRVNVRGGSSFDLLGSSWGPRSLGDVEPLVWKQGRGSGVDFWNLVTPAVFLPTSDGRPATFGVPAPSDLEFAGTSLHAHGVRAEAFYFERTVGEILRAEIATKTRLQLHGFYEEVELLSVEQQPADLLPADPGQPDRPEPASRDQVADCPRADAEVDGGLLDARQTGEDTGLPIQRAALGAAVDAVPRS